MNGLLIDDDVLFLRTLQRSLQRRGIETTLAHDTAAALEAARGRAFDFALVDMKIDKESGLRLIGPLKDARPGMRVVIMTGYASVATTVEAIKAGADDYLAKPVSIDAILRVLSDEPPSTPDTEEAMIPLGRLEWEHIQQALRETEGNISAAARLLGVQRRTLQRKLMKRPSAGRGNNDE